MKARTAAVIQPGRYRTRGNQMAIITTIDANRAHGSMPGLIARTWWYADSGKHALWPLDDIIERLADN